jgi:NADPH-dependent glutamate synthase beta subunit-like oxidoreductase/NAD-dependent dihydropyrimidine dehydrogenase PreA subunit
VKLQKDRLQKVIVIGATPSGIAATNKLGEMGIPVTLVESEADLDKKLSRMEWSFPSGLTLNYALRPGLIRIIRNPSIRLHLPVEVKSIRHSRQGFRIRLRKKQTFIDPERCVMCGKCLEACPQGKFDGQKAIQSNGRGSIPGRPIIDKRRTPPCQEKCPLGVNVQGYILLTRYGKFREALELIRKDNVLPAICGRICRHPCEIVCRRGEIDEPLAINEIKRFLADNAYSVPPETVNIPKKKERIAIIGSGPAGLSAAADLARFGYQVTVFEKEVMPGGLLRYAIGPYRLPREIIDSEIDYIRRLGVEFKTSIPINIPDYLPILKEEYNAIIIATGTWKDRRLGVPGEDLKGVEGCIEFLTSLYRGEIKKITEKVAVIGDGNSAFELARTLIRIGADVTVLSWFPEEMIPADREEIQAAKKEGVVIITCTQVTRFSGKDGKMTHLICHITKPGKPDSRGIAWPVIDANSKPMEYQFDRAIVAIGQTAYPMKDVSNCHLKVGKDGLIEVDASMMTNIPHIYAAGDVVTGPSSVVNAMASGRDAAFSVHRALGGLKSMGESLQRPKEMDFPEIPSNLPRAPRIKTIERESGFIKKDLSESTPGLDVEEVISEAKRCLQCGVCAECLECVDVCKDIGAINHAERPIEWVEDAGVIIIADPDLSPPIKGEDVIRAYAPKALKIDVYAMILRGFAAAADAIIMLGGTPNRFRGHWLSFSPPHPQLYPEIRIGVFICSCNESLGWHKEFDKYINSLMDRENIFHAEKLLSACTRDGSANILKRIREKGLTRIVIASCVCCPLDFICSACTDQRSRLKDAIFSGTGVSRSMVETCNIRGEVLWILRENPSIAIQRFIGLIERSISRAMKLKALPAPGRPYNFTTAVIGSSDAAISSAIALAEIGMEVFLLRGTEEPERHNNLIHPNIHDFESYKVNSIRGTLGNFQISVQKGNFMQILHVGAVIIGEKSRRSIPYIPVEDFPRQIVGSSLQKRGKEGIPFLYPGATSIAGIFLANPSKILVSERIKGYSAAILAASVMPRSPRYNKGFTVVVDEKRCRGCGRCIQVCPYQAVSFRKNRVGGWFAVVDEALCKGCGNCISVCPSNSADSPYRDQRYLEEMIEEIFVK